MRAPAIVAPHHHTYDSTDIDQSEDHRELGDVWKPDHLAVATLRRTVFRFDLRVAPAVTFQACRVLAGIGVPDGTRLVMEKPFGTDATSAEALNDLLSRLVLEDQVYRVDHYLGMATVLNIVGLRFANRMLESVLNADYVESVDVVFDETLALEGRAGYYDRAGALVDMIQSHSLQVLGLLAMEAPSTLEARDFRDSKALVLRATRVWDDDPAAWSRRARYTAGQIDGRQLPSYVDEDGVNPDGKTETFRALFIGDEAFVGALTDMLCS